METIQAGLQMMLDRRALLKALRAFKRGDFSVRMPPNLTGIDGEIAQAFNDVVEMNEALTAEIARVSDHVSKEGQSDQRVNLPDAAGAWSECVESVNTLVADMVYPVTEVARVIGSVAKGDLSQTMVLEAEGRPLRGEALRLGAVVNKVVGQLNSVASEVSRVAREVSTEGKLGGQAQVPGVAGVWKDLTDSVNQLAANLTGQMRNIAEVTTAVARGDLSKKITVDVKGEILELKSTINTMVDQLNAFAGEVSRVAKEVGTEGKLGGQAQVKGVAGVWKDLTDNVNRLAANLTTQVRAIAEVATAVAKGDLTRSITVEAQGEVASLKDNINEMIGNLKDTTRKNTEQDWLKTHLARFTRMLQGHRDLVTVSRLILSELTPLVNAQQAAFYVADHRTGDSQLELVAGYAERHGKALPRKIAFGEGLVGQCALERKRIVLNNAPPAYIRIGSALGSAEPANIVILPVLFEEQVKAVIELASFSKFSEAHQTFLDQLTESIGVVLHTIAANMQTEYLLHQSQSLTAELQAQQDELKKTNDRLEQQALNLQKSEALLKSKQEELRSANEQLQEKARQLSEQMRQFEFKNREVEQARASLEEKAEQLSLSSRYKSEFLANMSHELRTPLNSLLILARLLADNVGGNLTPKQVEFTRTIQASGVELLALINDILDLAKIESGTVTLHIAEERLDEICDYAERTFRQMATDKGLGFAIEVDPQLPPAMKTDGKRLQQIITNLLSNAFKFTSKGAVSLRIGPVTSGWSLGHAVLGRADTVIAFSVIDTGIGIPVNKQRLIFEAFQQADGTTSREFGGTGLGLSISRELARLLGGEIGVASTPGKGSTFTLYLPLDYRPAAEALALPPELSEPAALEIMPEPLSSFEAAEVAPQAAAQLAQKKVLVVDDDIRNVFALTSALEAHGMQVLHADSGKEGIEILNRTPGIDLVLMDVMMPGLDGFDTIRIVRQLDGYGTLPIVAVTAKAMLGDREKCIQAGANDYLAKPVNVDVLLATLARAMQPAEQH
jgi:signal transduction histidine kinase/HAMP domain-containing protein/ActR/RegA family two-component response regulator